MESATADLGDLLGRAYKVSDDQFPRLAVQITFVVQVTQGAVSMVSPSEHLVV